ncbi:hypothetical protein [Georgenia deserti]|uniref:PH domain-containing protein n=1 Tax=Georgenia deserti TaxID=2093781 RepID=A0ABW4L7H0_9MICO
MAAHPYQAELGDLLEVHRPAGRVLGWAVPVGFGLPFGLVAGFGPPGPAVGVVIFLLIAVPMALGGAEWFFLEHRLYEHGMVLRSIPILRTYVIPHHTIDPASFETGGRRVHDGGMAEAVRAGNERRFRVTFLTGRTVRFVGLHPERAHRLNTGALTWHDLERPFTKGRSDDPVPATASWWLSYRSAERHRRLIEDAVRRSAQEPPRPAPGR